MKYRSLLVCVLLAVPASASAASREIQDLQRDVGLLQQQIKDFQRSQDEKLTAVLDLARQALEASNRANAGVAAVTGNMEKTLGPLRDSVAAPIAGVNSKLESQGNDVRALQQAVADLSATMTRIQSQLGEIKDLVKAGQQAPAPPAPLGVGATGPPSALPDAPSASAGDLYNRALGDYRSGKYDLAVDGFNEFLKFYPNDKLAPNSQYYIGLVYYSAKNYEKALDAFSGVLDHYVENPKTSEARLYKGRSLLRLGRRNEGVVEFRKLLKDDPKSETAKSGCEELKDLGMNCTAPGAANRAPAKRKK